MLGCLESSEWLNRAFACSSAHLFMNKIISFILLFVFFFSIRGTHRIIIYLCIIVLYCDERISLENERAEGASDQWRAKIKELNKHKKNETKNTNKKNAYLILCVAKTGHRDDMPHIYLYIYTKHSYT